MGVCRDAVVRHPIVDVDMQVDPAWGEVLAIAIDDLARTSDRERFRDGADTPAVKPDVEATAQSLSRIDQGRTTNQQVKHEAPPRFPARDASRLDDW